MGRTVKLVILGGGGFRVPLVHASLMNDPDRLVDELVLQDVDVQRLRAIGAVIDQQAQGSAWAPRVRMVTNLADALPGADMVFSAIRVGGLGGRSVDARVPVRHGLIGQETARPGGSCYGPLTAPVAVGIAYPAARSAPAAWANN